MTYPTTQPVTFDFAEYIGMFPEFSALSSGQALGYFNRAQIYCANTTSNPGFVSGGVGLLKILLYLLTSHIAWLNAPRDANGNPSSAGVAPSPIVGRISQASEGSVSVSSEWKGSGSPTQDWYLQSRWGADYWTGTARFRTFRYAAMPTIVYPSAALAGGPWAGWPAGFLN